MFLTWTDLGSVKHVTEEEVIDGYRVCQGAMEEFMAKMASIPVDNAAKVMATKLAKQLTVDYDGMTVLVLRDPSHCVDLLSKDLASCWVVKSVMDEAKEVRDLVKKDRIDSIRTECYEVGDIDESIACVSVVETRMNLSHDFITKARGQHDFVKILSGNKSFLTYYQERTSKDKEKLDGILERCNDRQRWEQMDMLIDSLTIHFKVVHALCSREGFPLSAYPLLVQGLRNDLNRGLNVDNGRFDTVLGENARACVASVITQRFNMDGKDPTGQKVGLLDRHHLMCFLVDPYNGAWRSKFEIQTNMAELVMEMIALYVPKDPDGSSTSRNAMRVEFKVSVANTMLLLVRCFITCSNLLSSMC